jgi:hypothetical protein
MLGLKDAVITCVVLWRMSGRDEDYLEMEL